MLEMCFILQDKKSDRKKDKRKLEETLILHEVEIERLNIYFV